MTNLPVPDEATVKLYTAVSAAMAARHESGEPGRWEHPDSAQAHVRAIAAPVVAAELRRLASDVVAQSADEENLARRAVAGGAVSVAERLLARADQLDG